MIFITIEQIKYFLAINEYKSFSLAAHELCISQSSLSKHIKALENELQTLLFDRNTRSVDLTDAGVEFTIHAKKFLNDYNNIVNSMKKYSMEENCTIKIGTIPVIAQYGLTSSIALFKNNYPDIILSIIEGERDDIIKMLDKNEIDFAFLRDFELDKKSFNINPLVNDELVLITEKNHPFSKKKYINLKDAQDENFILLGSKSGIDRLSIDECNKHGFEPNVIFKVNKIETILGLVSEGLGITLLMKRVISSFNNNNIYINLLKDPLYNSFSLVFKNDKKISKNEILFKDFIINSVK